MNVDDILKGGKYKGKSWREIYEIDKDYIQYMATKETTQEKWRESDNERRAMLQKLLSEKSGVSTPAPAPEPKDTPVEAGSSTQEEILKVLKQAVIILDKIAVNTERWE